MSEIIPASVIPELVAFLMGWRGPRRLPLVDWEVSDEELTAALEAFNKREIQYMTATPLRCEPQLVRGQSKGRRICGKCGHEGSLGGQFCITEPGSIRDGKRTACKCLNCGATYTWDYTVQRWLLDKAEDGEGDQNETSPVLAEHNAMARVIDETPTHFGAPEGNRSET